MRKTVRFTAVLALLCSAPAFAEPTATAADAPIATNEGWNRPWALLFSFNNILVANAFVGSPITGSIGGVYYLSPDSAVRAGVTLGRSQSPVQVTKVTATTGDTSVTTYQVSNPTGFTEFYNVNLRAEYLRRLMRSAIAPYVGAGGSVGWTLQKQNYVDDLSVVDQRTEIDNKAATFDFTVRAVAGAEWRIHPNFAFYVDYNVALQIVGLNQLSNRTSIESTVGGVTSSSSTLTERTQTTWVTFSTGLSQGASLGMEIMF